MIIVDVREKEEFESERIPDSICLPLSQIDLLAPGLLKSLSESKIVVMCKSGKRSALALNDLKKHSSDKHQFSVYEGGIDQWKKDGKNVVGKSFALPIMRQVQIVASSMIFAAFLAAHFIHPNFVFLALFVGFGLALAGYTGICPMAFLLQKLPWNKASSNCSPTLDNNKNSCCG
jgi:rhodanese-related sulfurtransferase